MGTSRSRNSKPEAPSAGLVTGRERVRLILLFLFAALIAGVVLSEFGGPAAPRVEEPEVQDGGSGALVAETVVTPWAPPLARINEIVKQRTREERVRFYPEALGLLADRLRSRALEHFRRDPEYRDVGQFELVPVAALADPARSGEFRGRPVEVLGTFDSTSFADPQRDLGLDESFSTPVYEGYLGTDEGPVRFSLVGSTVVPMLALGSRVKVRGVFYRVIDEDPTGDGSYRSVPWILAKSVDPILPIKLVDTLPPDFAELIRDIETTADQLLPPHLEPTFWDLLGFVLANGRDALPEGTEPLLLRGLDPLERPDTLRLEPVRVTGTLVYLFWESFEWEGMRAEDAPGGLLGYWHAVVSERSPEVDVPISVILPFEHLPAGFVTGARVDITGLYYKVHAYAARKNRGTLIRSPFVMAVEPPVVIAPPIPAEDTTVLILAFAGLGVVIGVLLFFAVRRDRKRGEALQARLREARLERRRSSGMDLNRALDEGPGPDRP